MKYVVKTVRPNALCAYPGCGKPRHGLSGELKIPKCLEHCTVDFYWSAHNQWWVYPSRDLAMARITAMLIREPELVVMEETEVKFAPDTRTSETVFVLEHPSTIQPDAKPMFSVDGTNITAEQLLNDQTYKTFVPTAADGDIIGEPMAQRLADRASSITIESCAPWVVAEYERLATSNRANSERALQLHQEREEVKAEREEVKAQRDEAYASMQTSQRNLGTAQLQVQRLEKDRDEWHEQYKALRACIVYARDRRGGAFDFDEWNKMVEYALRSGFPPPHALEDAQAGEAKALRVIDELREKVRAAEAVRDDARAASQKCLDENRDLKAACKLDAAELQRFRAWQATSIGWDYLAGWKKGVLEANDKLYAAAVSGVVEIKPGTPALSMARIVELLNILLQHPPESP